MKYFSPTNRNTHIKPERAGNLEHAVFCTAELRISLEMIPQPKMCSSDSHLLDSLFCVYHQMKNIIEGDLKI